jgi:hypothetical protein
VPTLTIEVGVIQRVFTKYLLLVKGAVSHYNGLFFQCVIVCVHIIMPMRTQHQQELLQQIAVNVGVPVAKQQGNNNLNIIGTHGVAGQMPPTPSQPFTVNATPVPTIVNVGGNGGGGRWKWRQHFIIYYLVFKPEY